MAGSNSLSLLAAVGQEPTLPLRFSFRPSGHLAPGQKLADLRSVPRAPDKPAAVLLIKLPAREVADTSDPRGTQAAIGG